ncbi:MAG TPA: class I SAM-dependent methyltransferase [Candidatus Binatia bacterium]|nr:class I SAM-dependent methyltransferase [Candidatus Binatia bacterium]
MRTLEPTPADPRMLALLSEAGFGDAFHARQHRSCELVDRYVLRLAIDLARDLGLAGPLAAGRTASELEEESGLPPAFRSPLRWLLAWLAQGGLLEREANGAEPRYRLSGELPRSAVAEARAEGIASDPSYEPTYAMLDEAAVAYRKVASGEATGERALFQKISLWAGYFSNANAYYALNNRVAAAVAAEHLPAEGGGVLEVGAGLGSATAAFLDRLATRERAVTSYRATEPVAFFRRRAERTLSPTYVGIPIEFSALDVNEPWQPQGIAPGSYDLVWGVNVFHLARRLDAVLGEARRALAPGGWLVVGEGMRPRPGAVVAAEFPFQLLDGFVDVEVDPVRRPTPGFLAHTEWRAALERAGFEAVGVAPDVERLVEIYPAFYAAAVFGRR